MAEKNGTRLDTWQVNVMVEHPDQPGVFIDYDVWDTKTGGALDSEERLYYPGGMRDPYSLGGRILPGQVTVSRNYRVERDHFGYGKTPGVQQLIDSVGISRVIVSQHMMDRFHKLYESSPIVYTGTLKTVTLPEHNSESASDPAMIELVITVDTKPTGPR